MLLQTEGDERLDLFATRVQFNELITMFPNMKRHLSDDSTIIHNPVFERAIVKLQGGCEKDLTTTEKRQIRRFETSEDEDEQAVPAEGKPRNRAQMLLDEHRRKQARLLQSDKYRLTKHILPTTNIVERLFSRAKLALTDHRKSMTPRHLELLMFLRTNRSLWNAEAVEAAIALSNA